MALLDTEIIAAFLFGTVLRRIHGKRWKGSLAKIRILYNLTHTKEPVTFEKLLRFSLLARSSFSTLLNDLKESDRVSETNGLGYSITESGKAEYEALLHSFQPMVVYVIKFGVKGCDNKEIWNTLTKFTNFDLTEYEKSILSFDILMEFIRPLA